MKVVAEFSMIPIGVGVSLSQYIAACKKVLEETDLKIELHGNGTNIEGEWDQVMLAIKRCHEVVHQMGAPRISSMVKVATRIDREETLSDKIKSVERIKS